MSPKQGRHRRGPGGPRRTSRSAPSAPPARHRPGPELGGLVDPTLEQLVTTVVEAARHALDPNHPAPGVVLEQWAIELSASSFAPDAMPEQFYADLGRGLSEVGDPLAPAVLAALAVALDHPDAAPLRQARRDWLLGILDDATRAADLGIGREVPVGAVALQATGDPAPTVVVGFAAAGGDHTLGLVVEPEAGELWVGPALPAVVADAEGDPDLTVTDLGLVTARRHVDAALLAADDDLAAADEALLPLLLRRLDLIG